MIQTSHTLLEIQDLLYEAAALGCLAPSVLNSQPWRWRIRRGELELRYDPERQLRAADPDGRMMVFSCGAAAHHASVALAAQGAEATMEQVEDPADPELLARFTITGRCEVTPGALRLERAMRLRRTDRRPFEDTEPLPDRLLTELRQLVRPSGVSLHVFDRADLGFLSLAARAAGIIERRDAAYQSEILAWSGERDDRGDGVPPTTVVPPVERAVPVRDYGTDEEGQLPAGSGTDQFTTYLAFVTDDDTRADWLRTGEAVSNVLLTVTTAGYASSIMSDVIEVPGARALLRGVIRTKANPQLMVRVGRISGQPVPAPPRRSSAEVIEIVDER